MGEVKVLTAHQTLLLEMLKDFDAVCREHHISYQLFAGTALGVVRRIGQKIEWACGGMQKMLNPNAEENGLLVTAMVLFCASGTGIYGAA